MIPHPKLDLIVLQERCSRLRSLLETATATEPDAQICLRELTPLFQDVLSGQIAAPWDKAAPCGYYFHEGSLRNYPALEEAYAKFSTALQGWDDTALEALFNKAKQRAAESQ